MPATKTKRDALICTIPGSYTTGNRSEQHVCEVKVSYSEGGTSWYTGKQIPRCFKVSLSPVRVGEHTRSFSIDGRTNPCGELERVPRFNKRKLDYWAEQVRYPGQEMRDMLDTLYAEVRRQYPEYDLPDVDDWNAAIAQWG